MQIDHFSSPFATGIVYKVLKSDHIFPFYILLIEKENQIHGKKNFQKKLKNFSKSIIPSLSK